MKNEIDNIIDTLLGLRSMAEKEATYGSKAWQRAITLIDLAVEDARLLCNAHGSGQCSGAGGGARPEEQYPNGAR